MRDLLWLYFTKWCKGYKTPVIQSWIHVVFMPFILYKYIYMCVYLRVWLHTHVYKHERLIMNIHFCFVVETFGIFIFLIGIGIPFHSMTPKYLIDFYVRFWLWWVQIGCLSVLVVSLGGLHHWILWLMIEGHLFYVPFPVVKVAFGPFQGLSMAALVSITVNHMMTHIKSNPLHDLLDYWLIQNHWVNCTVTHSVMH